MFADIARRYDFLNHFLSLNADRRWRRQAARKLRVRPGDRLLDVCTGTADLALELSRRVRADAGGYVVGVDFCQEMVHLGERKRRRQDDPTLRLLIGDALALPFPSETFHGVTVAFGIRNVCDLRRGVEELHRVLKPDGRLAILEFNRPRNPLFRRLYHLYFHRILPWIGRWLSGHPTGKKAYSYLPSSVDEFPSPTALSALLEECGFTAVRYDSLSWGISVLHLARRRPVAATPVNGE